jgi:hypothetical protein
LITVINPQASREQDKKDQEADNERLTNLAVLTFGRLLPGHFLTDHFKHFPGDVVIIAILVKTVCAGVLSILIPRPAVLGFLAGLAILSVFGLAFPVALLRLAAVIGFGRW